MRTLLVLRHAKSDWDSGVDDVERPLAKRGRKASVRIGRFLALAGPRPNIIVTSVARRARETVERAAVAGGWDDIPMQVTDALYEASPEGVLEVIRAFPDSASTAMIVGHEPTLSALVGRLSGGGQVVMVTGALATVELDATSWDEVDFGMASITRLIPPRSLVGLGLRRALEEGEYASSEGDETD
jgi:phosphohistidine phosphatase